MAGFISERWPASNRNGGRHQIGIPGRLPSESAINAEEKISAALRDTALLPNSSDQDNEWPEPRIDFEKAVRIGARAAKRMTGFADSREGERFHAALIPARSADLRSDAEITKHLANEIKLIRILVRAYLHVRKLGVATRAAFKVKKPGKFFQRLTPGLKYDDEIDVIDVIQIAYASTVDVCELYPNYEVYRYVMEAATAIGRLHRLQPVRLSHNNLWVILSVAQLEPVRFGVERTKGEAIGEFLHDELEKMAPLQMLIPRMQEAFASGQGMTFEPSINWMNFPAAR